MRFILSLVIVSNLVVCLSACSPSSANFAPVVDVGGQHAQQQGYYTVQPGETIYFVAWRVGIAYQDLIRVNHLSPPYQLTTGMQLRLPNADEQGQARHSIVSNKPVTNRTILALPAIKAWQWPAKGYVIKSYSPVTQGIDISGQLGSAILASAAGEVVYSGSGLSS